MLQLQGVSVFLDDSQTIISDLSVSLDSGKVYAFMGPNGSGKSSLALSLMGHPHYEVKGAFLFEGQDLLQLSPDKRAKAGLFLSAQHPQAVPGVTINNLLKSAFRALYPDLSMDEYKTRLKKALGLLKFDELFLARSVHDGFSGGEKKRCEMVQLLVLQPKLVILDEIDSGLDVDALKLVGEALQYFKKICPNASIILITHYQRILDYIQPDIVHVLKEGKLVASGDHSLVKKIEEQGYDQF